MYLAYQYHATTILANYSYDRSVLFANPCYVSTRTRSGRGAFGLNSCWGCVISPLQGIYSDREIRLGEKHLVYCSYLEGKTTTLFGRSIYVNIDRVELIVECGVCYLVVARDMEQC